MSDYEVPEKQAVESNACKFRGKVQQLKEAFNTGSNTYRIQTKSYRVYCVKGQGPP